MLNFEPRSIRFSGCNGPPRRLASVVPGNPPKVDRHQAAPLQIKPAREKDKRRPRVQRRGSASPVLSPRRFPVLSRAATAGAKSADAIVRVSMGPNVVPPARLPLWVGRREVPPASRRLETARCGTTPLDTHRQAVPHAGHVRRSPGTSIDPVRYSHERRIARRSSRRAGGISPGERM